MLTEKRVILHQDLKHLSNQISKSRNLLSYIVLNVGKTAEVLYTRTLQNHIFLCEDDLCFRGKSSTHKI